MVGRGRTWQRLILVCARTSRGITLSLCEKGWLPKSWPRLKNLLSFVTRILPLIGFQTTKRWGSWEVGTGIHSMHLKDCRTVNVCEWRMIAITLHTMIYKLVSIGMYTQFLVLIGMEGLLFILGYATLTWRRVLFVPATSSKYTCLTQYLIRFLQTLISSSTSMTAKAWDTEILISRLPKTVWIIFR